MSSLRRLRARLGPTAFAGLTSLLWAVPLCAWAGGVDFNASAWLAFALGAGLLPVWAVLIYRARAWPPAAAGGLRYEPGQMSAPERRWWIGFALAITLLIGWLNAAATVDLGLLRPGLAAGSAGAWALAAALLAVLAGALALAALCWARAARAYRLRVSRLS